MGLNAVQLAYHVASGKKALTELSPRAKKRVQYVLRCYGETTVKDLATHQTQATKIGHRASLQRKVHIR